MSRHRSWTFTDFHGDSENDVPVSEWLSRYPNLPRLGFACLQREVCPDTGRYHIQGYLHLSQPVSLSRLKKSLPRAHLEVAKGSPEQNRVYCSKAASRADGPADTHGPFETGVLPAQGARTDLSSACESIKEGKWEEVSDVMWAKYHRGLMAVAERYMRPRSPTDPPPRVYWYWGSTGVGKSRRVSEEAGDDVYWAPGGKWWCGYRQQKSVVLDDFRPEDMSFHHLLKLLDRYPYRVEWKGGGCWVNTDQFFITAPDPPQYMYQNMCEKLLQQLIRRITLIEEIK
jgi:hypothetical protein